MDSRDFPDFVHRYMDAFDRHDLGAWAAFYSEQALLEAPWGRFAGRRLIQQDMEQFMRAFPDASVECRNLLYAGTQGIVEWTIRATHSGPLRTARRNITPTGGRLEITGVSVWELCSLGLIIRERLYEGRVSGAGRIPSDGGA